MHRSKKPKRPYKPGFAVKPLNARDAMKIEGPALAAMVAVTHGAVTEETTTTLAAHADIVRLIARAAGDRPAETHAEAVLRVVCDMQVRGQQTGRFAPTPLEIASLRASVGFTTTWLSGRKNKEILDAAAASLRSLERLGGIRLKQPKQKEPNHAGT